MHISPLSRAEHLNTLIESNALDSQSSPAIGKGMPPTVDLTGATFNNLTVVKRLGKNKRGSWLWECRCCCGEVVVKATGDVKAGRRCHSCAGNSPALLAQGRIPHGLSHTQEFKSWFSMKRRCSAKATGRNKALYFDRGIRVCDRWENSFPAFLEDMGKKPSPEHSIDRIDNTVGYEPGNCRWATTLEQSLNRKTNCRITFNGKSLTYSEWAKETGINRRTISSRARKGWPPERILKSS
jgi:hypothetical protein